MKTVLATWGTLAVSLLACVGGEPDSRRPSECAEDPSRPGCRLSDPECRTSPKSGECLDREYFRTVVKPIFERNCAVCHVEGGLAWGSTSLPLTGDSAWDSLVNKPSNEMAFTRTPMMRAAGRAGKQLPVPQDFHASAAFRVTDAVVRYPFDPTGNRRGAGMDRRETL